MTHGELVRRYLPLARDREVMFILWEMTPFPCWHPDEELQRLAAVCAPVRKRGWYRKLRREARRIENEIEQEMRWFRARDEQEAVEQRSAPPDRPRAVDPVDGSGQEGATRDTGSAFSSSTCRPAAERPETP